jgi:uncharacterized membrane protein YeaQ/YmgE (transglycosylase-associated protein family)
VGLAPTGKRRIVAAHVDAKTMFWPFWGGTPHLCGTIGNRLGADPNHRRHLSGRSRANNKYDGAAVEPAGLDEIECLVARLGDPTARSERRPDPVHGFAECQTVTAIHQTCTLLEDRDTSPNEEVKMSIIGWIVLGLIAGFIASKIVNKTGAGFLLDIVLGIVGAVVGGFIFTALGASAVTGFNLYSMIVAIIGAIVVLLIYHAIAGRRGI